MITGTALIAGAGVSGIKGSDRHQRAASASSSAGRRDIRAPSSPIAAFRRCARPDSAVDVVSVGALVAAGCDGGTAGNSSVSATLGMALALANSERDARVASFEDDTETSIGQCVRVCV